MKENGRTSIGTSMPPVGRAASIAAGTEDALIMSFEEGARASRGSTIGVRGSSRKGRDEPRPYSTEASIEQEPVHHQVMKDSMMKERRYSKRAELKETTSRRSGMQSSISMKGTITSSMEGETSESIRAIKSKSTGAADAFAARVAEA